MKNIFNNIKKEYLLFDFIKYTAAPLMLWFRPKVTYNTSTRKGIIKGGALLISNHNGFSDPVIMMLSVWYRRHRFICMKELAEKPYGFIFSWFRCIPIDRDNLQLSSFREVIDALKNDELVSMFPEGAVNREEGTVSDFKSGMVLMALFSGKPIVPMYIKERKSFFESTKVAIGKPIDVTRFYGERPTSEQIEKITRYIYKRQTMLKELI